MTPEKPKRTASNHKKVNTRLFLIAIMVIPLMFIVFRPGVDGGLFADGLALSIMITASLYIMYQGIIWALSTYLEDDVL